MRVVTKNKGNGRVMGYDGNAETRGLHATGRDIGAVMPDDGDA